MRVKRLEHVGPRLHMISYDLLTDAEMLQIPVILSKNNHETCIVGMARVQSASAVLVRCYMSW